MAGDSSTTGVGVSMVAPTLTGASARPRTNVKGLNTKPLKIFLHVVSIEECVSE